MKALIQAALFTLAALLMTTAMPAGIAQAQQTHFNYKIVKITHSSTTSGHDISPPATAHSTAKWHLAKAIRKAKNRFSVDYTKAGVVGSGFFNIRGSYSADATVDHGYRVDSCRLVAPTGSRQYGLLAPGPDQLSVIGGRKGLTVTFGTFGGGARVATSPSGGGYFDSGCTNTWHFRSEQVESARTTTVPFNTFRRKQITLRFKGGYSSDNATARWTTTFVLKRIDKKKPAKKKSARRR